MSTYDTQQSTNSNVGGKLVNFTIAYSNCSTNLIISDKQMKMFIDTLIPGQYMCGTGTLTVFPNNYIRLHDIQTPPLGGVPDVGQMVAEMGK